MKISALARRITILSIVTCASCSTFEPTPDFNTRSGLPIVQGLTNESATQIAIVAPESMQLKFSYEEVTDNGTPANVLTPAESSVRTSAGSKVVVHHLQIEGLRTGTTYRLIVQDSLGQSVDQRLFRMLDTKPRPVKIIAASCLYDRFLAESRPMWKSLIDEKPDLLLLIGDNVYAELANGRFPSPLNEKALWIRYSETFLALDYYKAKMLIPTLVTWDDHDYGMRDGNRDNPYKAESKRVMESFFAQDASPSFVKYTKGPGVSSKFDAFGYRFLLLDNRSFRTPKQPNPKLFDAKLPTQSHFGAEQEQWIFRNVTQSPDPVWLISGDQWFGGYHKFESYEGTHPLSFQTFLKALRGTKQKVFFLSGDRHLSEVSRIEKELLGYETYEFTSSSMHSKSHPSNWDTIPNRRHLMGVELKHNFVRFDLTPPASDGHIHLHGSSIGAEMKRYYTFDLDVRPLQSQTK